MSWVGRALSSVTQYYKEINPSTLSGAIDVIVVERRTPSTSTDGTFETYLEETELVCTPFHVRFGKLSVLRPSDRRVVVRVNGKEVPLAMKVAETGEAFFVFETDDSELPEEMQTSPLARPVRDNPSLEPEPLDLDGTLGTSATSASKRPQEKESKLHNQDGKDLSDASKGGTAFATRMAAKATEVGSAAASEAISATGEHLPKISQSRNQQGSDNDLDQSDAAHLTQHQSSVSAEVKQLERQLESQIRLDAPSASPVGSDNDPGAEVRREAKREESLFPEQECQRLDRSNRPSDTEMEAILKETINTMKNNHSTSHLLNLDMEGYKVGSEQQSEANSIENHVLSRELGGQNLGRDVLRFTQSLLRSADLEKSRHGAEVLTTCGQSPRSSTYAAPKPESASSTPLSSSPTQEFPRASSPTPSIADSTVTPLTSSSTLFSVSADGSTHTFELALCPKSLGNGTDAVEDLEFNLNRITFDELRNNSSLVNDRNLVCRFGDKYLTWDNASPVLASLVIYQDSIASNTFVKQDPGVSPSTTPPASRHDPQPSQPSRWSSWFGGGGSRPKSNTSATSSSSPNPNQITVSRPRVTSEPAPSRASRAASPEPFQGSVNDRSVRASSPEPEPLCDYEEDETDSRTRNEDSEKATKKYAKTLRLTSEQLKQLNLKKGRNDISFSVMSSYSSNVVKCTARIFLWDQDYKVVISDIDGTITKSDALGHVFAMVGRDWTHHGVAKLYTDIARNGYKLLYLTSRAIGQADTTREYLRGISQNNCVLPEGPVIMSPDRLMTSLHREVIARKPEVFKMACLQDVQNVFQAKPFYAGFGNRITDALSYRTVDIPSARIFTIDSYGDVKMELLELAGYKSSYIAMTDLVDQMFPPVNREAHPEFSDFNYWRPPLPKVDLPDFSPPSPPTSAQSGPSKYSLRRITSSITGRTPEVNAAVRSSGRQVSASKPTSPLQAAVLDEEEPDQFLLDSRATKSGEIRRRANSSPDTIMDSRDRESEVQYSQDDSDSIRKRAIFQRQNQLSDDEGSVLSGEDDDGFPMDDMDFSSVSY